MKERDGPGQWTMKGFGYDLGRLYGYRFLPSDCRDGPGRNHRRLGTHSPGRLPSPYGFSCHLTTV
jgi:hypothetical protein